MLDLKILDKKIIELNELIASCCEKDPQLFGKDGAVYLMGYIRDAKDPKLLLNMSGKREDVILLMSSILQDIYDKDKVAFTRMLLNVLSTSKFLDINKPGATE